MFLKFLFVFFFLALVLYAKALLKKCRKIIGSDGGEVNIHALGNAIRRAINLTLTLTEESGQRLAYEATTSSKPLIGMILLLAHILMYITLYLSLSFFFFH